MEYLKSIGKCLYVGFLDYEKAFGYFNRANIINHLKEKGVGAKYVKAIASMYKVTRYIPKICNKIGDAIIAKHGVTQGRQTSTSVFSFEVQDMPKNVVVPNSIIRDYNVLQLAYDSALFAEDRDLLRGAFSQCTKFSAENYMFANVRKTVFLHLAEESDTTALQLEENTIIEAAENNEHTYLGVKFVASNNIIRHIQKNFQGRMYNVNKFYDWLSINEFTPVKIKLQVLYTCMFNAYLYAVETWWQNEAISKQLLALERKLLKMILCIKSNIPDDLIYLEIDRPDIMAVVKHRQCSFYKRLIFLGEEDAIVRKICSLHRHLPIIAYYEGLDLNVVKRNKSERIRDYQRGTTTYVARYHELIDLKYNHIIYDSFIPEKCRILITRWRLSCHSLKMESCRRDPYIERHLRLCMNCTTVEDEEHAIFCCPLYDSLF